MVLFSPRPCCEGAKGCPSRSVCRGISAAPKVCKMGAGWGREETEGNAADGRESWGGEEGGETGKESIRRTGCASQSEACSGAAAAGAAEPGRAGPRSQPGAL